MHGNRIFLLRDPELGKLFLLLVRGDTIRCSYDHHRQRITTFIGISDQHQKGNLFTLFLHSPLTAFCYICNIVDIPVAMWDKCQAQIDKFIAEASKLFTRSRSLGEFTWSNRQNVGILFNQRAVNDISEKARCLTGCSCQDGFSFCFLESSYISHILCYILINAWAQQPHGGGSETALTMSTHSFKHAASAVEFCGKQWSCNCTTWRHQFQYRVFLSFQITPSCSSSATTFCEFYCFDISSAMLLCVCIEDSR